MESWKQRMIGNNNHHPKQVQGRSKLNAPCKKHPKHKQSPGVCSICLSKRLSKISNSPADSSSRSKLGKKQYYSSASSSSYSYSSSLSSSKASSCSSPVFNYTCHVDVLKKSKSMAFVLRRRKEDGDRNKNVKVDGSSNKGFWSKLKSKGLMRSKTVRENRSGGVTQVP